MSKPREPRFDVDEGTAARLVRMQFPRFAEYEIYPVIEQGWDNRVFRVGTGYLARFPTAKRYESQIERTFSSMRRISKHFDFSVPELVGIGSSDGPYPFRWAITSWIEGIPIDTQSGAIDPCLASQVGEFLAKLHLLDASDGPQPGRDNFHRGGSLRTYEVEARLALQQLSLDGLGKTLERALESDPSSRHWVHGDVSPGNLLVRNQHLVGVIDWGLCAVGDPACDVAFGWTFLKGKARDAFLESVSVDEACLERARGWALWKAAILASGLSDGPQSQRDRATLVLAELAADAG